MKINIQYFMTLKETFLEELQEKERGGEELIRRTEACIDHCEAQLKILQQLAACTDFPDEATEIYFFKELKALVNSRYFYYLKVHEIHIGIIPGCSAHATKLLQAAHQKTIKFLEKNKALFEYHRAGAVHNDRLYYTRGQFSWKSSLDPGRANDAFSTSADLRLARVMASELLLTYTAQLLEKTAPANDILSIPCMASPVEVVELGYALYAAGFFRPHVTIKAVMEWLSKASGIDLHKYYDTFIQIKERKKDTTKYLEKLKVALLRYIDTSFA